MRFSCAWLGEYVELPPPQELAARLTAAGHAVDEVGAGDSAHASDAAALEVDVTTNRPDCMNHLGLAREAATILDRPLRLPAQLAGEPVAEGDAPAAGAARVVLEDPIGCSRYAARVVRGVEVGPSPDWLKRRLESIGQRPINNVVDVTNFVLWECGQPLHAFDLTTLVKGGEPELPEIRVRRARAGERLTTLDGEERELTPAMLVIADAARPVALAGVMGGLATEVTAATTDVLIESAHFDPKAVRAAASALGMHTDASHRFERGADPEICRRAADRAAALIAEVGGGEVLAGAVDERAEPPQATAARKAGAPWPPRGRLTLAGLHAFVGAEIPAADVDRWLAGLGFDPRPVGADPDGPAWEVTVPSWRWYDIQPSPGGEVYPADLYEEALRLYGFDPVPATLPAIPGSDGPPTPAQLRRERIRRELTGCGYAEAINFAFQSAAADAAFPALAGGLPVELANALSDRYAVMRRSLVPNLVDNARFNRRRGADAVRLYEIGRLFAALGEGEVGPDGLPVVERETVAMVAGGAVGTPWDRRSEIDLFDLKGVIESLGEALGTPLVARPAGLPGVVPGTGAELFAAADEGSGKAAAIGWLGRIDDPEADPADPPLFAAELATDALGDGGGGTAHRHPVAAPSRFPSVGADLTLTHPLATPWVEIAAAVEAHRSSELVAFGLKDRYTGEGVPAGAVNTTLWFVYGAPDRSLTQEEVNLRQAALAGELTRRFAPPPTDEEGSR